jgi:hypothetical protein
MDYYQLSQKSTYIFSKAVTEAQEYYLKGQATFASKVTFFSCSRGDCCCPERGRYFFQSGSFWSQSDRFSSPPSRRCATKSPVPNQLADLINRELNA